MDKQTRFDLPESALPRAWYNINADLPSPLAPPRHPQTGAPVTPEFLEVLMPRALIAQDAASAAEIEIPEPVREVYKLWRPTPLLRARRLEAALETPAHIYYKYEGVSPVGSHKPNTAVAQAFYLEDEGGRAFTTETGAGQWGSALSMACQFFGLGCEVYMVRVSYEQKPFRRFVMESYGGSVYPSPSPRTAAGRALLERDPDHPGSLGIAISEAIEMAAGSGGAKKYSAGSFLPHVLLHQTVIGLEALQQMDLAGEYPDVVIGCAGGGSNFGGIAFPFVRENLRHGRRTRIVAAEPSACPTLTRGVYAWDYADGAGMAPIIRMHTLGHGFVPPGIHAGGLRYHGMAPQVSALLDAGLVEAVAIDQLDCFEAGVLFGRAEGILPAPESNHAVRAAIDEALAAKAAGEKRVILFNLSGHGNFDMAAYGRYMAGELERYDYPAEAVAAAMRELPEITDGD
ncbi:MAG: TrpB-like pyridoxal phosphate-dependent enzyme [Gammaproteobacteria bacterium]|nr:TrpB-like pyridoxal phosphate-dependent enzyme [Gammaproteobacteria bacterium]MCP5198747.1 TrpB-like pyridoxal phosphate-dependent enzyme [Gammaproteobacteria bacterium]